MNEPVTIYHNPSCSKSRQTLELIRAQGIEPVIVEYLQQTLDPALVLKLATLLGGNPAKLVRTKEAAYKRHGLSASSSPEELARAIVEDPILLERPIVVRGHRAALGRPPENVLDLLK